MGSRASSLTSLAITKMNIDLDVSARGIATRPWDAILISCNFEVIFSLHNLISHVRSMMLV